MLASLLNSIDCTKIPYMILIRKKTKSQRKDHLRRMRTKRVKRMRRKKVVAQKRIGKEGDSGFCIVFLVQMCV